jgi:hypothetical protein
MKFLPRFLIVTALVAWLSLPFSSARAAGESTAVANAPRDFIELRAYRLKTDAPQTALDVYLEKALIPALNQRGVEAVGVFTETEPKEGPIVWVLIPYKSLELFVSVNAAINTDPAVQTAGADYLVGPTKANPAFERIDSWLFLAFTGQPHLAVPALAREKKSRIFELRTYESYSEERALKKIQMFNEGEIGAMQEVNLSPVFYGQALTGPGLPRLAYLLCSPDRPTHDKNWKAFQQHPTWLKEKNEPQYRDTVSKSINRFLVPKPYSQI